MREEAFPALNYLIARFFFCKKKCAQFLFASLIACNKNKCTIKKSIPVNFKQLDLKYQVVLPNDDEICLFLAFSIFVSGSKQV